MSKQTKTGKAKVRGCHSPSTKEGSMVCAIYNRLLADLCAKYRSDTLEVPPEVVHESWILSEAPKLDKRILQFIEERGHIPYSDLTSEEKDALWDKWNSIKCDSPEWLHQMLQVIGEGFTSRPQEPNISYEEMLRDLHMLLVFGYKAELHASEEQIAEAQASFEKTDQDCYRWTGHLLDAWSGDGSLRPRGLKAVLEGARSTIQRIVANVNWHEIVPSHGPGSVFPSRKPSKKADFKTLFTKIQQYYPFDEFFLSGKNSLGDTPFEDLQVADTITCKLIAVPKDSRGPRLICVHPAESIWIQQGQRELLESAINNHPMTRGRINFDDQSVNGVLALSSSLDRRFATIDLKDASDRMSDTLVRYLFGEYAYGWMSCARATHVKLIDERVIEIQKWAPMGNCLTFPVESLVFWAIARSAIEYFHGPSSDSDLLYVFGDDILCCSDYVKGVMEGLEMVGLMVNRQKSFYNGFFRESCGVDAYHGIDITPLRLRVAELVSVSDALSISRLALAARRRGLECLASYLYTLVRDFCGGKLSLNNDPDAQGLFEYVDMSWDRLALFESSLRWNNKLHRWEVTQLLNRASIDASPGRDWYRVLDSLVRLEKGYRSNARNPDQDLRGPLSRKAKMPWISERGTGYPIPHRDRLTRGWAGVRPS